MDERLYRALVRVAVVLALVFTAVVLWQTFATGHAPGDLAFRAGENLFADGNYGRALVRYDEALADDPHHLFALRARSRTLMMLDRHQAALAAFDDAIAREPGFATTWANRGILLDRMGRHAEAIADYERALALEPELNEGPHWLTRFLRNQPERPPGIGDRAAYLRAELARSEDRQVLRLPEQDAVQRPYKR